MNNTLTESVLAEIFAAYKSLLWSLSYHFTGNAADADDVVQETFIRAWQHPPARTDEAWLPWLVRVASNLGHDLLRWRRRSNWSCEATATEECADERSNPAMPLELLENVTAAFLHAMEALTPRQQLLLMLRDVFDYSVRDTASVLQMSEANVKTALTGHGGASCFVRTHRRRFGSNGAPSLGGFWLASETMTLLVSSPSWSSEGRVNVG